MTMREMLKNRFCQEFGFEDRRTIDLFHFCDRLPEEFDCMILKWALLVLKEDRVAE